MPDQKLKRETKDVEREEERRKIREKEKVEKKKPKEDAKVVEERFKKETYEPKLKVPIIELEKVIKPAVKETEIDAQIPEIKKERRELKISLVTLDEPFFEPKEVTIEKSIPIIERKVKELRVPLIKLELFKRVRTIVEKFNTNLPPITRRRERIIRVPIYRKTPKMTLRTITPSFAASINKQVERGLIALGKRKKEEIERRLRMPIKEEERVAEAGLHLLSLGKEEGIPEPFNFIFKGLSSGKLQSKGTKIVLFKEAKDDSYIGSFVTLCRRIYREKHGGEPDFQPIEKLDEMNKREIEKWLDANKRVVLINLDTMEEHLDEAHLKEKLEATLGKFGFVIFKTKNESLLGEYNKKLENINKESPHPFLDIVKIGPQENSFPLKKKITELAWGNLNLESIIDIKTKFRELERYIGTGVFDDLFNRVAQKIYDETLEKIKLEEGGIFKRATARNRGQIAGKERDDYENGESPLHYNIKVFLVRYLVHKLRKRDEELKELVQIKDKIKTEEKFNDIAPIPDIQVDNEVYEVETLFGQGEEPLKKIDETIGKYGGKPVDKVNIVLDNFTFLRHIKEIKQIAYHYQDKKNKGENLIGFYTLDLRNKKLLSLYKLIKKLQDLKKMAT